MWLASALNQNTDGQGVSKEYDCRQCLLSEEGGSGERGRKGHCKYHLPGGTLGMLHTLLAFLLGTISTISGHHYPDPAQALA